MPNTFEYIGIEFGLIFPNGILFRVFGCFVVPPIA